MKFLTSLLLVLFFSPVSLLAQATTSDLVIPESDPSLSPDVLAAIRTYAETREAPVLEGDSRTYPYGIGTPVLNCAPLRVCAVLLEEGETVWEVLSGDTSQWQIHEAYTGPARSTPVVAIKPLLHPKDTCNKTTNLLITTNRRVYTVLLHLPQCAPTEQTDRNPNRPFDSMISFYYPQETVVRWSQEAQDADARRRRVEASEIPLAPARVLDLNWNYSLRSQGRPRFPWKPIAAFDDGQRTYIQLPAEASEAPAIFTVDGRELSLLNSNLVKNTIVIDRVLPRLLLSLPGPKPGKNRQLLVINRKATAK